VEIPKGFRMARHPIIVGDGTARIPLTRGLCAVLDLADLPLVEGRQWHVHERPDGNGFYARSGSIRMHRLILGCQPGVLGDHRDGDGLNNRRSNLRIGTRLQNSRNRRPIQRNLPVGVRQIGLRFYARINISGQWRALGGHATAEEAHAAYATAAAEIYGEWLHPSILSAAHGNS
jgi:hypothetical protein